MEYPEEDSINDELQAFAGPDSAKAKRVYERLSPSCRRLLQNYFKHKCGIDDATRREDLEQTVLVRLWEKRQSFKPQGEAAWYGYVRRIAFNCFIDDCRRRHAAPLPEGDVLESLPDTDLAIVEAVLAALDNGVFFETADQVLLDDNAPLAPGEAAQSLLAAQYFYLDGEPWETVVALLRGTYGKPVTRRTMDAWLTDPRVIRRLVFGQLYWENVALSDYLLQLHKGAGPEEAQAIQWRYRYGLLPDHIEQRKDCSLSSENLKALFDRCGTLFPFREVMVTLHMRLKRGGVSMPRILSADNSVWQRLAFQYRYSDQLPHRDILERTQSSAEVVGFKLNSGMLNVWLANARLLEKVARRLQESQEDKLDDKREGRADADGHRRG